MRLETTSAIQLMGTPNVCIFQLRFQAATEGIGRQPAHLQLQLALALGHQLGFLLLLQALQLPLVQPALAHSIPSAKVWQSGPRACRYRQSEEMSPLSWVFKGS